MSSGLQCLIAFCSVAICLSAQSVSTGDSDDASCLLQAQRRTGSSHSVTLKKGVSVEMARFGDGLSKAVHKDAYFGQISVGTPAQLLTVVYDTGSGNLLIPGERCTATACQRHHHFSETQSSTFKNASCGAKPVTGNGEAKDWMKITFATGYIKGPCVQDQLCIGNLCASGNFVAATEESVFPFSSYKFDGVLGMAMEKMAHKPEYSMIGRMVREGLLKEPLFSVFLSDSDAEGSEITFGEIKKEHMASEMFWVPVSNQPFGFWEVKIDDFTIANKKENICKDCRVAIDTGTSQLACPSNVISLLRQKLYVKSDCSNYEQLPDLGLAFGKHVLNLAPRDYIDSSWNRCRLALTTIDVPPPRGPLLMFGIPFLQKFFTAYDHANERVGFAVAKHDHVHAGALVSMDSDNHEQPGDPAANEQMQLTSIGEIGSHIDMIPTIVIGSD